MHTNIQHAHAHTYTQQGTTQKHTYNTNAKKLFFWNEMDMDNDLLLSSITDLLTPNVCLEGEWDIRGLHLDMGT